MSCICPFTNKSLLSLNDENIKDWEKLVKFSYTITKNKLNLFCCDNKEDYIKLINTNINNADNIIKIYSVFKQKQQEYYEKIEATIKAEKEKLYNDSIKYVYITSGRIIFYTNSVEYFKVISPSRSIMIRILNDDDIDNAYILYTDYKKTTGDEIYEDDIKSHVQQFILNDNMYGIFEKNILIGICIKSTKKFNIDGINSKIDTFYIQEIFVNRNYKGRKLGECLFKYILDYIVSSDFKYISFMTQETNKAMHKIAYNYDFIRQVKSSGDSKNPVLYIKNNI